MGTRRERERVTWKDCLLNTVLQGNSPGSTCASLVLRSPAFPFDLLLLPSSDERHLEPEPQTQTREKWVEVDLRGRGGKGMALALEPRCHTNFSLSLLINFLF